LQHVIAQVATLLLERRLALDEFAVEGPHVPVEFCLDVVDVEGGRVGVGAEVGDGEEVGVGEQLFLEVLVPAQGLVQDLVGLAEDIVVDLGEVAQDEALLLWQQLIAQLVGNQGRVQC
jgi:hypothetical protein